MSDSTLPHLPDLGDAERGALAARYELLEEVGRGGMGAVYRARHLLLDRQVAVKVCLPGQHPGRFAREAQLLAKLRSPHVVAVHDFDHLGDGRALLVMDWVEGADLGKLLREARGPLSEGDALPWMRQVCEGMRAAAEQGITHRDLKPSNVLIDADRCALVADFGLARDDDAGQPGGAPAGGVMGTPLYMSPEQAEDARAADERSDVYSFGATFYHVLAGRTPFRAESTVSVLFKHRTEPLTPPRAHNPALSDRVNLCLERCLAKSPADRFQSFAELGRALSDGEDAWDVESDPALAGHLKRFRVWRELHLDRRLFPRQPQRYPMPGGRSVVILHGELASQDVDAVVSPASEQVKMNGTSSRELARAAGPAVLEEVQRYVPVRQGRAVVTGAGELPARFVFHAVTTRMANGDEPWVPPTRDILNEVMESCFYHAETLGVRTIAFPLMSRGVDGFPREVCLDTMFRFLARKLARGATCVREARIVLA